MTTVVGVDACPGGWVAVALSPGRAPAGVFVRALRDLPAVVPDAVGFGIDIPIGLPTREHRRADVEAQAFLGPRRSSVFHTPVREALTAPTHAEGSRISRERTGKGVSQQAYALGRKILEAEAWSREVTAPVWEVHPEVSFALLLGEPARSSKKTWAGIWERRSGLERAGIELGALGEAGERAAPDDVLDAAAVAWSTDRLVRGVGISLPDPPERHPVTGEPMAIWA